MGRIGPFGMWELVIILVVVLLIFGPRLLPQMARGIGQSVREFRNGIRDMKKDFDLDPPESGASQQKVTKAEPHPAESTASATPAESKSTRAAE
ncbi:MAG: twin-arginine translocase TatA/TatE family subunit [Trueperaceae bacterium]